MMQIKEYGIYPDHSRLSEPVFRDTVRRFLTYLHYGYVRRSTGGAVRQQGASRWIARRLASSIINQQPIYLHQINASKEDMKSSYDAFGKLWISNLCE